MTAERAQLTVRIPADLKERLQAEASARVIGVNLLTTLLLIQGLDRLPPVEDFFGGG